MAGHLDTSCECGADWNVEKAAADGLERSAWDAVKANFSALNPLPTDFQEAVELVLSGGSSSVNPKDIAEATKDQIDLAEYEETVMEGQGLVRDGDSWACPECGKSQYDVKWA